MVVKQEFIWTDVSEQGSRFNPKPAQWLKALQNTQHVESSRAVSGHFGLDAKAVPLYHREQVSFWETEYRSSEVRLEVTIRNLFIRCCMELLNK